MASLTGKKIKETYDSILKTIDNEPLDATKKKITDGVGNESGLSLDNQGNVDISSNLNVAGTIADADGLISNTYATKTELTTEESERIAGDDLLQAAIDLEEQTRILEDTNLQDQITSNDNDIAGLEANKVPYTGATGDVDLGANQLNATSIQITGGTGTQGTLSWNTEDETIDLIVSPDVTYQLGQELGQVARNLSGVALNNGAIVKVTGASGNKITIDIADNLSEYDSASTFAVVTEYINNNSTGRVTTNGLVRGLNTSAFTEGVALWLGTNGQFTNVKPLSPKHLVHIGWVVRSHATEGAILVHISNGWELEELHDVLITNVQDGHILEYDSATGLWINTTSLIDEINNRIAEDDILQTAIDLEETARINADTTLQSNIDAEESSRIAADTTLQGNIDTEEASRIAADDILQTAIDLEEATRISEDTTLQTNISNEESARITADSSLQTQISSNDTDISQLNTDLSTEITNRQAADITLQTNIDSEESARITADSNLQSQINANDTDIASLSSDKEDKVNKGAVNGYASLDSGAKVPISQLPDSVVGQVEYQGTWDASTDTPTLPSASGVKGHYYVTSVAGTYLTISFEVGDWVISNGTAWEKVDNTDAVTSVFGRLGNILANESDYSGYYPLISDLTAETNARTNADNTLQSNIDTEEAARISADNTLQTNINTESSTRATADTNLQNQITSNDSDISTLQTDLTNEIAARILEDGTLQANIDNLYNTINYVTKSNGSSFVDSIIYDDGTNVGIGTSPLNTLTIAGNSGYLTFLNPASDGVANSVIGRIASQTRTYGTNISTNSFASIEFATDSSAWYKGEIRFLTNGSDGTGLSPTERMRIKSGGDVTINERLGIGISPSYKLDVNGDVRFTGNLRVEGNTDPNSATAAFFWNQPFLGPTISGYNFEVRTGNTGSQARRLFINETGAATFSSSVSVATFLRASAGAQSNPTGGASIAIDYQTTSNLQGRIRSRDWDGAAWKNLTIEANNIILSPSGNVGIGTTNPSAKFEVYDANGVPIRFGDISSAISGQTAGYIGMSTSAFSGNNGDLVLYPRTSATSRILLMGGNVGIGTNNPQGILDAVGVSYFTRSSKWIVVNPNYGSSDTHAQIQASSGMALAFATNGDNERMRITSGGNIITGEMSSGGTYNPVANGWYLGYTGGGATVVNFSGTNEAFTFNQRDGGGTTQIDFRNGDVERGKIEWTTSGTTYNTSSDYRLKTNINPLNNGLNKVLMIEPKTFNYIDGNGELISGFIAHELQEIIPEAVTGKKDDVREDGTPKYQGVDHSRLVPVLVKAIQELKAELDALKNI